MFKACMIPIVLLLCVFSVIGKPNDTGPQAANPDSVTIPPEVAHQSNPIKATPESLARGKKYYSYDCALCHGESGDGKTDVAIDEKLKLKDLSDPATLKDRTDGELFYLIQHGRGHMPMEQKGRLTSTEVWSLVNYIRSLSQKAAH